MTYEELEASLRESTKQVAKEAVREMLEPLLQQTKTAQSNQADQPDPRGHIVRVIQLPSA